MLLTHLELHNFLAYGAHVPVSLDGIRLACLSGPNGAGKSSMLDAVTWSLWGRARARSDEELIHVGQTEMAVTIDFQQGGVPYRVIRKRNAKGRGTLDLFVFDDDQWKAQNGESVRDTQSKIIQLLHLDYETFVNSAFLQQGKADSFTLKTPGERKKILADILGLKRWETFEDAAKKHLQKTDADLAVLVNIIHEKEQYEQREPELRVQLEQADRQAVTAREALAAAEAIYAEVMGAADRMRAAKDRLAEVEQRIQGHQRNLSEVDKDVTAQEKRLDACERVIADAESIEQGYAELAQARQTDESLKDRMFQHRELETSLNGLQRERDMARAKLDQDAVLHRSRIAAAEQQAAQIDPLIDSLTQIEQQIAIYEGQRVQREALSVEVSELTGESNGLLTVNKALEKEMDALRSRLQIIKAPHSEPVCPVCGQPLDEEHKATLIEQFMADGISRRDAIQENKQRSKAISQMITQHESALRTMDVELRRLDTLNRQVGEIRAQLARAQESGQQLEDEYAALAAVETVLASGDYAAEISAQMATLYAQIEALGYDEGWHAQTNEMLKTLNAYDLRKRDLDVALETFPGLQTTLAATRERRERWQTEYNQDVIAAAERRAEIDQLKMQVDEEKRRHADLNRCRIEERNVAEAKIGVEQALNAVYEARNRRLELTERRDALTIERAVYDQLRDAFGKNGVPAMIIEAAIPELEDAANKLLTRITDGKMNVRFDTQKEKKTGGVSETLDILISDELGTRDYALYSGGEGFRVNFAVRVALSQFLARRAGAQLQTLFIDEGFGSQDVMGRERLLEAINAISNEFDLILVVTHIDELQDAFPVHIRVSKGDGGATVEIG